MATTVEVDDCLVTRYAFGAGLGIGIQVTQGDAMVCLNASQAKALAEAVIELVAEFKGVNRDS